MREIDTTTYDRAHSLIARGLTMEEVARRLGISRVSLYRAGFRSARGYMRRG